MRNLTIFLVFWGLKVVCGHYQGPFLLWGVENLNEMKIPTLQAIDDQNLRDIYSKASAVVIFIRNATTKLSYENFPELSEIIGKNEWLYLPQEYLSSDPLEYNVNAEVFTLTGPAVMQDNEVAAFYRDAQINYGNKNVLGILAARSENPEHLRLKREVSSTTEASTSEVPVTQGSNGGPVIYEVPGKGLLYSQSPLVLKFNEDSSETNEIELKRYSSVTADERVDTFKLIIKFLPDVGPIWIRFIFQIFSGSWSLSQVEYHSSETKVLDIVGSPLSAPMNFSYACNRMFVFRKDNVSLVLNGIQVQPKLGGESKFSRPYECVGFMTAPILSGIFVTSILFVALSIALSAILDIKPPNKFENRSSKQLTFTVQE